MTATTSAAEPFPRTIHTEPPSVLVLTRDEEANVATCLRSLSFSDDVVVFDSHSTDRTVEIARGFANVRVVRREFDTFSKHRNWAIRNIPFKHPWLYVCDADEVVPPELRDEIVRTVNDPDQPHVAFRLRYKNMFMNRWIRYGGMYPVWILRLYRPDKVTYEDREVNAHPIVDGSVGELKEHFIHYSFNKGLVPWFQKHNVYSSMEAREAVRVLQRPLREHFRRLSDKDKAVRRRALKNISFYLPARSVVRFLYMYVYQLGFLDGTAGFHYAAMISTYEYWTALKIRELQNDWVAETDRVAAELLAGGRA